MNSPSLQKQNRCRHLDYCSIVLADLANAVVSQMRLLTFVRLTERHFVKPLTRSSARAVVTTVKLVALDCVCLRALKNIT